MREADDAMRGAFERILGDSIDEVVWTQAGLSPSAGGLGLRHSEDMAVPAFVGSAIETAQLTLKLMSREAIVIPGLQDAARKFTTLAIGAQVPPAVGIAVSSLMHRPVEEEVVSSVPRKCQAALQKSLDEKGAEALKRAAAGNARDRLDAVRRPHASSWITCFPNKPLGLHMPNQEFQVSCRAWLGLTTREENKALLKPGVAMYGRHHAVQECLLSMCRSAGVPAKREVLIDTSGQRPADVFLPNFSRGQPFAVDVTVSHPSQSSTTRSDGTTHGASASERAALDKVALKNHKY